MLLPTRGWQRKQTTTNDPGPGGPGGLDKLKAQSGRRVCPSTWMEMHVRSQIAELSSHVRRAQSHGRRCGGSSHRSSAPQGLAGSHAHTVKSSKTAVLQTGPLQHHTTASARPDVSDPVSNRHRPHKVIQLMSGLRPRARSVSLRLASSRPTSPPPFMSRPGSGSEGSEFARSLLALRPLPISTAGSLGYLGSKTALDPSHALSALSPPERCLPSDHA